MSRLSKVARYSMFLGLAVTLPHRPVRQVFGTVVGEVREERSGRVLDHAVVHISGAQRAVFTDAQGRFQLDSVPALPNLRPDYDDSTVVIIVRKLGYFPERRELLVRGGTVDTLDFRMRPDPRPIK